ncbi:MAG: hypothetical protein KIT14_07010 [bacterium]|nr:hypothetical protein [bacterium]
MHRPIRTATLLLLLAAAAHAADPGQNSWFRDGRAAVARAAADLNH